MTNYYGCFRDIRESGLETLLECSVYDAPMNKVYHLNTATNEELDFYVDELANTRNSILELCCGNGRITIPLVKKGFIIDGIDISKDMLELLWNGKEQLPKQFQRNMHIVQCDVFSFQPEKNYDAIILPATTISILVEFNEFHYLLDKIFSWLNDDGKFIFDYCVDYSEQTQQVNFAKFQDNGVDYHLFYQDFVNREKGKSIANFYLYMQNGANQVEHYIASAKKTILGKDEIVNLLSKHGFHLINNLIRYENGYGIEMLSFGKGKDE